MLPDQDNRMTFHSLGCDSGSQPAAFASVAFQVLTRCLPAPVVSLAGAVDAGAGSSLIVSDEGERRKRDVGRGGGR